MPLKMLRDNPKFHLKISHYMVYLPFRVFGVTDKHTNKKFKLIIYAISVLLLLSEVEDF